MDYTPFVFFCEPYFKIHQKYSYEHSKSLRIKGHRMFGWIEVKGSGVVDRLVVPSRINVVIFFTPNHHFALEYTDYGKK